MLRVKIWALIAMSIRKGSIEISAYELREGSVKTFVKADGTRAELCTALLLAMKIDPRIEAAVKSAAKAFADPEINNFDFDK